MERLKWHYYELQRWHRLARPEPSVVQLIGVVGRWWLIFHGARREHRIHVWRGYKWYAPDLCIPRFRTIVEADGGPHLTRTGRGRDYIRDFRLREHGWYIMRVTTTEMTRDPRGVRRRARAHLLGRR